MQDANNAPRVKPKLQEILDFAAKRGATDIHLTVGSPPACRVDGQILFYENAQALSPHDTLKLLEDLLSTEALERFKRTGDADAAVSVPGLGRYRVNILRQRGSIGVVLRHVRSNILDMEALRMPPAIERIAEMRRGIVLFTGGTLSGKSTTIAAVLDRINRTRREHIITLEDPIEYLHTNCRSIVTQREIGIDTKDYASALSAAMREDPDVISIGEIRDADTFNAAVAAAEMGCLVFATLHMANGTQALERIIELFPENRHSQARSHLALQLRACVAQRLVPAADGRGRVPAVEVLMNNPTVARLIRDNDLKHLGDAIAAGRDEGMQTFNASLADLVHRGLVHEQDAVLCSDNPDALALVLKGLARHAAN